MELHPLPNQPPQLAGWQREQDRLRQQIARVQASLPKTISEVLAEASMRMDAEDEQLERDRDPLRLLRPSRRSRTLLGRLFGRR